MKNVYRDLFKAARLLTATEQHLQKALDELDQRGIRAKCYGFKSLIVTVGSRFVDLE